MNRIVRMKILFIIDSLRSGGKERRLVSLITGLTRYDEIEMELITLSDKIHYKSVLNLPIKIHYLRRDIRKDLKILSKFNTIVNNLQPDIVHCWDNIAAIHFAPICRLKGIPFINSMITAAPKVKKFSKRYITNAISYPFSDVILSNSQAGLDTLFVPKNKQKVIYNGFNFNRLLNLKNKSDILKKFGIQSNRPIIGMVASFNNHKDYRTIVESAYLLKDTYTFITVGDGDNFNEINKKAKVYKLENFYLLGKQTDVESIVNIFDIGVLLSNPDIHGEGISNAIMEYMALSKPVIASRGGGTGELVVDGETGFLINPKNPEQLVEKIIYLVDHKEIAKQMGEKGSAHIEQLFSIDKMIGETYQLYKSVLSDN